MKKVKHLIVVFLSVILLVIPLAACNNDSQDGSPDDTQKKETVSGLQYPEVDPSEPILERNEPSDTIYVVRASTKGLNGQRAMTQDEKLLLQGLQGVVAQRKAEIYIGAATDKYLKYIRDKFNLKIDDGRTVYTVDGNGEEVKTDSTTTWLADLGSIVKHYTESGDIKGYVKLKYQNGKYNEKLSQTNQACTIAGAMQYLMVTEKTEANLNEFCPDVKLGKDISTTEVTQFEVYKEYESMLSKDVLIMQAAPRIENLREYGISQKAGFYFYNESDSVEERDYVYKSLNMLANAYGWEQIEESEDGVKVGMTEDPSVDFASQRDVNVFAADWCTNLSVWMSMPVTEVKQKEYKPLATDEEQMHYVTMLYSDGDNIQWTAGGGFANDFYLGTKPDKKEMPFGWTLTPSLAEVSPGMLSYIYDNMTDIEHFVGSVSGYAYSHPANFSDDAIALFARNTGVMMKKADMDLLAMKGVNEKVMQAFSDQEEFKGGYIMYGADSGKGGQIYWANGKPFVHDRYIMWKDAGDMKKPDVIAKMVTQLRYLSTDKTKSSCYSFIQVHCWSYKYADIVNLFNKEIDNTIVKVITPAEFTDLILENVAPVEKGYTDDK